MLHILDTKIHVVTISFKAEFCLLPYVYIFSFNGAGKQDFEDPYRSIWRGDRKHLELQIATLIVLFLNLNNIWILDNCKFGQDSPQRLKLQNFFSRIEFGFLKYIDFGDTSEVSPDLGSQDNTFLRLWV